MNKVNISKLLTFKGPDGIKPAPPIDSGMHLPDYSKNNNKRQKPEHKNTQEKKIDKPVTENGQIIDIYV